VRAATAGAKPDPNADANVNQPHANADTNQPDADPERHPDADPDPERHPDADPDADPDRYEPESERLNLADPGHHRSVPACQPIGLTIGKR
jgi:hypothetical protein